jgi:hypothetical protein
MLELGGRALARRSNARPHFCLKIKRLKNRLVFTRTVLPSKILFHFLSNFSSPLSQNGKPLAL